MTKKNNSRGQFETSGMLLELSELKKSTSSSETLRGAERYGERVSEVISECIAGNAESCRFIATLLQKGESVPKNKVLAKKILQHLSLTYDFAEHPKIKYSYAKLLISEGNTSEGIDILDKLIAINFVPAFYLMGNLFEYGTGVDADHLIAMEFYSRAAKLGHYHAKIGNAKLQLKHGNIFGKLRAVITYMWVSASVLYNKILINNFDYIKSFR